MSIADVTIEQARQDALMIVSPADREQAIERAQLVAAWHALQSEQDVNLNPHACAQMKAIEARFNKLEVNEK